MPEAPDELLAALRALPAVAALRGEPGVHAVGGAVRDLLLGRRPHEVDLVVEGDAVALVRRLGLPIAAAHERFGTATVRLPDGATADLASARTERYDRPGALPEVAVGATLEDDLRRRDFTVNAIAVALDDGRMTPVPGALDDLGAGVLRVLHPGSFADDPTRLLRGARYGARLGFAYDTETEALARAAVAGGALDTVTRSRLGSELRLLLREPQPDAVERLAEHGLGQALFPSRHLSGFAAEPGYLERALALTPSDADPGLVALAAALRVTAAELGVRLRELGVPARQAGVLRAAEGLGSVLDALEDRVDDEPPSRGEIDGVLQRKPPEVAVLAAATPGAGGDAARRWLQEDRHRRLEITGDDLVAAGLSGPALGAGLAAARAAMLDGTAPDRETQLAVALAA